MDPQNDIPPAPRKSSNLPATFAILAIAIAVFAAPYLLVGGSKDIIPWRDDLAAAKQEATDTGKLLLLDFTADWCGPCKMMKATTFADETVKAAIEKGFIPVKMDLTGRGQREQEIGTRYDISGVPTYILLDANGAEIRRRSGVMPAQQFIDWLSAVKKPVASNE